MRPFYFGSDNSLFGIETTPENPSSSTAFILCPPFGQEYLRCHKFYADLANNFTQYGFHTLRFDFFGCGDSQGLLRDVSLSTWLENIEDAICHVKKNKAIRKICLFGIRFGATLALLYSNRSQNIESIIAWAPVLDGSFFLKETSHYHKIYLMGSFANSHLHKCSKTEYLGFEFPAALISDINKLQLTSITAEKLQHILLIHNFKSQDQIAFFPPAITEQKISSEYFWIYQSDLNKVIHSPQEEQNIILSWSKKVNK